jgi:phage shock protein PspC (stress-responsive transcriptional regulator)
MNAVTQIDPAIETTSTDSTPLPLRAHNIFGVCEALGEDFGFNPMWLRVPFAASVLISPLWSIVGYLALGVVVLGSRLLFPARKSAMAADAKVSSASNSEIELSIAA